ncbi:hypothetical protein ACFFX0_24245 [Citricoccus parietis]|uniref:Uncharacterized protein n=1 Tax=Citricoccus parietis TaxID=592307 RepID=A0ABV5G5A2_9MICC
MSGGGAWQWVSWSQRRAVTARRSRSEKALRRASLLELAQLQTVQQAAQVEQGTVHQRTVDEGEAGHHRLCQRGGMGAGDQGVQDHQCCHSQHSQHGPLGRAGGRSGHGAFTHGLHSWCSGEYAPRAGRR